MEEIKKRPNPFEKKIDEMSKQVEEPKTAKKETTSKSTTTKKASTTTKKPAVKKPTTKTKTVIDPKTGTAKVVKAKETTSKASTPSKKATTTKKASSTAKKSTTTKKASSTAKKSTTTKKPTTPKVVETPVIVETQPETVAEETIVTPTPKPVKGRVSTKDLTIEPGPRQPEPPVVRPTPKKTKVLNKEEKVLYKKLEETFNYVANLTSVIEERTMDTKNIPDLTLGELHVIEMVNNNNNKPMSLIAKKLKVTVGSLIICVNRLVQKEYLLRIRDEMDHRVILLSVTPKAKKVLKFHDKFHEDILGLVLEQVNLAQAVKVMSQFANMLEYYYDPKGYEKTLAKEKKK